VSEVFRCDYCGSYAPLPDACAAYALDYQTDTGDEVFTVTMTCSSHCAKRAAGTRVGGR
jgi:hypothetical protein